MSTRTCQLCGKPLSRLWVGGGDDFCSREHRNQYRIKRSMDQLQEANKVSTLMRRREHPKPVAPASHPGILAARAAVAPITHPNDLRLPTTFPALHRELSVRLPSERSRPMVLRASLAAYAIDGVHREFDAPRLRIQTEMTRFRERTIRNADSGSVHRGRGPRHLHVAAEAGHPLRVSASAAFRIPAPLTRIEVPEPPSAEVPSTRDLRYSPGTTLCSQLRLERVAVALSISDPVSRALSARTPAVQFSWPGAKRFQGSRIRDAAIQSRLTGVRWEMPEQTAVRPIQQSGPGLTAAGLAKVVKPAEHGPAGPRIEAAKFVTPEIPFGYPSTTPPEPEEPDHAVAVAPEPTQVPPPVVTTSPEPEKTAPEPIASQPDPAKVDEKLLEAAIVVENFRTGWENDWIGGVDDWPQDAPGVRTGSIAFFAPSLEMENYDLEFQTRIDQRSVRWLFRAANFREYHIGMISVAPGGGYEFTRATERAGTRVPAAALPLQLPLRGKNSFTVRMRALGSDFTVWVDGKRLATWTDGRLASGGIGFMGAPEDRARIYWIRLTPLERPGQENPKK
jgi:hypothetical protein